MSIAYYGFSFFRQKLREAENWREVFDSVVGNADKILHLDDAFSICETGKNQAIKECDPEYILESWREDLKYLHELKMKHFQKEVWLLPARTTDLYRIKKYKVVVAETLEQACERFIREDSRVEIIPQRLVEPTREYLLIADREIEAFSEQRGVIREAHKRVKELREDLENRKITRAFYEKECEELVQQTRKSLQRILAVLDTLKLKAIGLPINELLWLVRLEELNLYRAIAVLNFNDEETEELKELKLRQQAVLLEKQRLAPKEEVKND